MISKTFIRTFGLVSIFCLHVGGCAYYSFSGASIPSHLGTIAIPQVQDNSISTIGTLDVQMTSLLISRFVQQTRLSLESRSQDANATLIVSIDRYQNLPASVSGNERATRNRITIRATARYTDQVEDELLLDRSFSAFEEYDPLDPAEEVVAAEAALVKLVDDIFTAATSDW